MKSLFLAPPAMHQILTSPLLRPILATLAITAALRAIRREKATMAAGIGITAGWAVMLWPALLAWPATPLARLPEAGLLLLAASMLEKKHRPWLIRITLAAILAWWLRAASWHGDIVAQCVPVFFGLWAAFAIAVRLARPAGGDPGWARTGAALALAGAFWATGAATHWIVASLVVAAASAALVGLPESAALLARALAVAAAAVIIASNRGHFVPVDATPAAPVAAWLLAPRLTRLGPAGASLLAAAACIAAAWASASLWAH